MKSVMFKALDNRKSSLGFVAASVAPAFLSHAPKTVEFYRNTSSQSYLLSE